MSYINETELRQNLQKIRDEEQRKREIRGMLIKLNRRWEACQPCQVSMVKSSSATLVDWSAVKAVDADHVITVISTYFNVGRNKLEAKTRKREVVLARQIAMYFLKTKTRMSLKSIGETFGGRDHTTAIHSIQTVKDLMDTDENIRNDVDKLSKII